MTKRKPPFGNGSRAQHLLVMAPEISLASSMVAPGMARALTAIAQGDFSVRSKGGFHRDSMDFQWKHEDSTDNKKQCHTDIQPRNMKDIYDRKKPMTMAIQLDSTISVGFGRVFSSSFNVKRISLQ